MRRLMQLSETQKVTKKFLRETMTISQYNTARAHYGEALRVIIEEDVPNHEPPAETQDANTEVAAGERDRQRLRAEVAKWDLRVPPEEVEYIIQHNPYSKARALLWKCRWQDMAAD
jgi:hypothetical protein